MPSGAEGGAGPSAAAPHPPRRGTTGTPAPPRGAVMKNLGPVAVRPGPVPPPERAPAGAAGTAARLVHHRPSGAPWRGAGRDGRMILFGKVALLVWALGMGYVGL